MATRYTDIMEVERIDKGNSYLVKARIYSGEIKDVEQLDTLTGEMVTETQYVRDTVETNCNIYIDRNPVTDEYISEKLNEIFELNRNPDHTIWNESYLP